ncbi:MAG: glycoside hydrolase family 127 protein [Planctomycetota bacterium]
MRARPSIAFALLTATATAQEPGPTLEPPLRAVTFERVLVNDAFFAPRRATNRTATLPHAVAQLEETGTMPNFDLAARGPGALHHGYVFQDSDAYKVLEAMACALQEQRDRDLEAQLDGLIARVAAAQQPDGYLDTAYTVLHPGERWTNLRDDHELYCMGHLIEAGVAHFQATRKRTLLDVAVRCADLLVGTFLGEDARQGYPGHPELELALVQLARATGESRYAELARAFVDRRGSGFFAVEHGTDPARYDGSYWQDHAPVRELSAIAGHAVRAAYLMSGALDVAAATGDRSLLQMAERVWANTIDRNVFVTGGIGPSAHNEGFTVDFDLPTVTAYQESCASIALVMWAHRMNLLTGEARFADAMETALYNAIPAGVQLDGTKFFYVNPLASRGDHHRRPWYRCACCPPNLARTLARLGGYAYATGDDTLCVNLYVRGEVRAMAAGGPVGLVVTTDYPWDGKVTVRFVQAPPQELRLRLRVPGWCERAVVTLGGAQLAATDGPSPGYLDVRRRFVPGEQVELDLQMPVRAVRADPRAEALRGQVAFARGPIVYCVEQVDCAAPVDGLLAPPGTELRAEHRPDLLGGVTVLTGELLHAAPETWTEVVAGGAALYRPLPATRRVAATLVPYAVWDNRSAGAMAVWLPQAPPPPRLGGPELDARIALSFTSGNCVPEGLRDGVVPERSRDTPAANCHFWPHEGGTEWAQYEWAGPRALAGCRVFWFDDTGRGQCRLPQAARLLWRDGDSWRPVEVLGAPLPIAVDRWCEVRFAPVTTTALRLEVDQQDGFASGVLEWQLSAPARR